ncbi:hypothetical protein [Cupriavidus basilensis]|uniref:hypothetical protein n=1 Tax=Cupriavidus basilensis TaxID=68895 RepID=UPI0039F73D9E
MDLNDITAEMIESAAHNPHLDSALQSLQAAAGITSGDTAALSFSFMDSENSQWFEASPAERKGWLRQWLALEQRHAFPQR